jgi:hypothetical protein
MRKRGDDAASSADAARAVTARRGRARGAAETPRNNGVRSVAEMLPSVGGAAFRRFGFVQSAVVSRWQEIVGARYAGVSSPESIRFPTGRKSEGTLTLSVEGAHAPMMQHVAPAIVERVNRFFGYPAISRVVIRQGAARPVSDAPRVAPPSLRPIPADIGDSLRAVVDPELRDVLAALAGAVAATRGPPRFEDSDE